MLSSKEEIINAVERLPKYEDGEVEEDRYLYVSRIDLEEEGYNSEDVMEQDHMKAVTEKGELKAVHVPSDKYTLEQHETAFKRVLDKLPDSTSGKITNHKTYAAMKLYPEGKEPGNVGLWVKNSVAADSAVRVNFIHVRDNGTMHIPKNILGDKISEYKRVHRGEWSEEFEDFIGTINAVRNTWNVIVGDLSDTLADDEDIEAIKDIVGSKASKKMDDWLKQKKIDVDTGNAVEVKPTLWDLILHGIKFVSNRLEQSSRVASEYTKEERLRKLSRSLMAYAL